MKKATFVMFCLTILSLCITSCSKDKDDEKGNNFAYPVEQLYGKWKATELNVNGQWYDVTKYPFTKFGMDITFYENGTFYGSGYLGNGSGTYKLSGKTIITYVEGEEYITYTVNSLSDKAVDLTLRMGNESMQMKAEKQ